MVRSTVKHIQDLKTDFSENECQIMINILNCNNGKVLTRTSISKQIGIRNTDPRFKEIIKYLIEVGIIKDVENIGLSKVIEINREMLRDFIDEQKVINWYVDKYFKKWHRFGW